MSAERSRYPVPAVPKCPDCSTEMTPGFMPDDLNMFGSNQSAWVEGQPVESLTRGVKLSGMLSFPITAFRCGQCGLLRLYAFRPSHRNG